MKWGQIYVATRIFKSDGTSKKRSKDFEREAKLYHKMNESNSQHVVRCLGTNVDPKNPFMSKKKFKQVNF